MIEIVGSARALITTAVMLTVCCAASGATPLESAWKEYRFQNFSKAKRIFRENVTDSPADEESIQARFGLAGIAHYQLPGRSPERALPMYEALLSSIPAGHKLTPAILYRIGECHYSRSTPDMQKAIEYFERVRAEHPEATEAREATMRIAYVHMAGGTAEDFRKAVEVLETDLKENPGHSFAGCFHEICAHLAISLGEHKKARHHLIQWFESGIANFNNEGSVLYMIANISEKELNDTKTALKYYKLLASKSPTDYRSYMCTMKIKELRSAGKSGQ